MADLRRVCPQCKRQFRPPHGSPRRYCVRCRPSRVKRDGEPDGVGLDAGPGPIEDQVRAELERTRRLDTIEGAALLALARDADTLTGTQRAGVVEKLLRVKALALAGAAPAEVDRLDDLARRRAEKQASA